MISLDALDQLREQWNALATVQEALQNWELQYRDQLTAVQRNVLTNTADSLDQLITNLEPTIEAIVKRHA